MTPEARGITGAAAVILATPLTLWLFLANPQTPHELRSRLALGLSPDRYGAELGAGAERMERAGRFFGLEEPSDAQAEEARRLLLEARARFRSGVARAGGSAEEDRAREAWASADLQLARWALARGKGGGPLRTDDEDLFRWGLAYAREGLRLEGVTGETRERLRGVAEQLDEELSLWR